MLQSLSQASKLNMKIFTIATVFTLSSVVSAVPPFDPAGAKNVGNGHGGQFIGGQCLSNADCGSGCCANPTGICSGVGAQTQNGKTGCGFGGSAAVQSVPAESSPLSTAAAAPLPVTVTVTETVTATAAEAAAAATEPATSVAAVSGALTSNSKGGPAFDPAGTKNVGNGKGIQFIGGQCLSAADCASGCCAGPSGICSGLGAQTQAGKTGCGFVSSKKMMARYNKWQGFGGS